MPAHAGQQRLPSDRRSRAPDRRERQDEVVHERPDAQSVDESPENGVVDQEAQLTAREIKDRCRREGDEEVEAESGERRLHATGKSRVTAEGAASDRLEDAHGRCAARAIRDDRAGDVEDAGREPTDEDRHRGV